MNKNHLHHPFENFMYYFAVIIGVLAIVGRIIQVVTTHVSN